MNEAKPQHLMSIRAFSERSRLTQRALRLYDSQGLLEPAWTDPQSGYRYYHPDQLDAAKRIFLLRQLEMPLETIQVLLTLEPGEVAGQLEDYWQEQEDLLRQKHRLVQYLRGKLLGRREGSFVVQTRVVPERKLLVMGREITRRELVGFIQESFAMLFRHLARFGTQPTAAPMVLYHWELDFESEGLVEVALPFEGHLEPAECIAVRLEPAHPEAFVRLSKSQVEYPDILHAYDALSEWLETQGLRGGIPREIYFAPWESTDPGQPAFDVAFPYQED